MSILRYKNDWHSDCYTVAGVLVGELTTVSIGRKTYPVKCRKVGVEYSDMGHTYTATSKHYFITEKVFGVEMEFDLNKIVPKVVVHAKAWVPESAL